MANASTSRPLGAWLSCLGAAALFGAATPGGKLLSRSLSPELLAGLLYLGAALAVTPWALRRSWRGLPRQALARVLVAVVVGGAVSPVLLLVALRRSPAADVSVWLSLETVFTGVVARLFFREPLGLRAWAANLAVVAGAALLALPARASLSPALLVAAACLGWALDNNLSAAVVEVSPAQVVLAKGLVGGGLNAALGWARTPRLPVASSLAAALGVGALGYGLSLLLYLRGARRLGAARSQMLFASAPVTGVALSWAALGEPVRPVQLAALGALALAAWLLFSERHEHAHQHQAVAHSHEHRHDDGHHGHVHEGLPAGTAHSHPHVHEAIEHSHPHSPDVHHRHPH